MQLGHPFSNQCRSSGRHKKTQSLDNQLPRLFLAARIQPQNAEGQRRINGSLGLLAVHAQHGNGRLALS